MKYLSENLILAFLFVFVQHGTSTNDVTKILRHDGNASFYYGGKERLNGAKLVTESGNSDNLAVVSERLIGNNVLFSTNLNKGIYTDSSSFLGCFFDSVPNFARGVSIWRYKPWNAWTKPIRINKISDMKDWDVQFFYWQYEDGVYGAAVPLSEKGFRTTIGNFHGLFGVKSLSYAPNDYTGDVKLLIVGFGKNPFELFRSVYSDALTLLGKKENKIENKKFPQSLDYLGWCTYNALDMGRDQDEEHIVNAVKSFNDKGVKLGWLIIDDGWFDVTNGSLNSFIPNAKVFPHGFKRLNERLKNECGLRDVGVWLAFNGYWNGINKDSELGRRYASDLFSWLQKPRPTDSDTVRKVKYYFIRPDSKSLDDFYNNWYKYIKSQGFSFLKVDNQLVTERMAVDNYPVTYLSEAMHKSMNRYAEKYFDGILINCMDMTADAYFNFGKSSVARGVEDYFPERDKGTGYDLERGGAAAHLLMALYNNLYFSQLVYSDFDMFESGNTNGFYHAIARAAQNGPIYLTDKIGEQKIEVIKPLSYSDGKLIRPKTPLTISEDCLFQLQDSALMKAYSLNNHSAMLCVWNMSDAESVSGFVSARNINGMNTGRFVIYDYFEGIASVVDADDKLPLKLNRMGYKLYHFIPYCFPATPIGLIGKYNCSGSIVDCHFYKNGFKVIVGDGGEFAANSNSAPKMASIDGAQCSYSYKDGLVKLSIPQGENREEHKIVMLW